MHQASRPYHVKVLRHSAHFLSTVTSSPLASLGLYDCSSLHGLCPTAEATRPGTCMLSCSRAALAPPVLCLLQSKCGHMTNLFLRRGCYLQGSARDQMWSSMTLLYHSKVACIGGTLRRQWLQLKARHLDVQGGCQVVVSKERYWSRS